MNKIRFFNEHIGPYLVMAAMAYLIFELMAVNKKYADAIRMFNDIVAVEIEEVQK